MVLLPFVVPWTWTETAYVVPPASANPTTSSKGMLSD